MPSYVVTGASRGIGLQFVKHLSADEQNQVFAVVRNKATANFLHELGRKNVTIVEADVTDAKALNAAAAEVAKLTNNKLDYLINNAGSASFLGLTIDQFPSSEELEKDLIDTFRNNTIAVIHSTNAFLPLLKNGSTKKVLTLSGASGHLGFTLHANAPGMVAYSIAKAALNMAVAKFAARYRADGFVFLSICPGMVDTSATQPAPPSAGAMEELKLLSKGLSNVMPSIPAPISPEESVKMQLDVFSDWPLERSGEMVSHFGNETRWI
ncbi:NAD(P)-binding protein [Favolaschia claudopus]|uniref:NAD(P)-binding protein n=1 Tax=Favolaschia claudopus TaxID=2862362 RepID=A0AAW0BJP4_9AGAR